MFECGVVINGTSRVNVFLLHYCDVLGGFIKEWYNVIMMKSNYWTLHL